MICGDFLSPRQRAELLALLRDGHSEQRLARRANALLLLDDGWNCEEVAEALYLDDDTVRGWRKTYDADGVEGLRRFEGGGSASYLSAEQEAQLKAWIAETLPRSTNVIGAYVAKEFGVVYESRSGLIAMLHRLGLEYVKPETIGRKLDPEKQKAFIEAYESLLNSAGPDEAVLFVDAVHPTHAARPVGCWPRPRQSGDRADQRTAAPQRSWRHRSRDRQDRDDRRRNRRRRLDDPSARRDRGDVSVARPDPCFSRQCALPPRSDRAAVAGSARTADQAALHSRLLPALEPDRALVGRHAQASDAQHVLCQLSRIRRGGSRFPAATRPQTLARISGLVTDNFRVIDPKDFRVLT